MYEAQMFVVFKIMEQLFDLSINLFSELLIVENSLSYYFPILKHTYKGFAVVGIALLGLNARIAILRNIEAEEPEEPTNIFFRIGKGVVIIIGMPIAIDRFFIPLNNYILKGISAATKSFNFASQIKNLDVDGFAAYFDFINPFDNLAIFTVFIIIFVWFFFKVSFKGGEIVAMYALIWILVVPAGAFYPTDNSQYKAIVTELQANILSGAALLLLTAASIQMLIYMDSYKECMISISCLIVASKAPNEVRRILYSLSGQNTSNMLSQAATLVRAVK